MESKYLGTTVNERLYLSGLFDEFYNAIAEKDYYKAKAILQKVELNDESINPILRTFELTEPRE
jgi:iron uptake system EfeUOB component EfeO/EfeM